MVLEGCFHGENHLAIVVNCRQYIAVEFLKDELCLLKTKMVDFDAFMGNLRSRKYKRIRVIQYLHYSTITLNYSTCYYT